MLGFRLHTVFTVLVLFVNSEDFKLFDFLGLGVDFHEDSICFLNGAKFYENMQLIIVAKLDQ